MKQFIVNGWHGNRYLMRADEIHLRVMNDSKESNFNWIASATELIRICSKADFPDDYATDIKIAILNCFANLEGARAGGYQESTDSRAIQDAYNSLSQRDDRCISAKKRYLMSVISAIPCDYFEVPIHNGKHYRSFVSQWDKSWFSEYWKQDYIDFSSLRSKLNQDFDRKVRRLEKSGVLEKEDEEFWSAIRKSTEWI